MKARMSLVPLLACVAALATAREPIVGRPCEGCEAVFQGLPSTLATEARIATAVDPGEPLVIEGTVRDRRGKPVAGVVVYAYHTNARGIYPTDERFPGMAAARHGKLRGWVETDAAGTYRFRTIRPGGYPGTDIPQHVHMHVLEPGRCTYYVDDVLFEDDPRLTKQQRERLTVGRGGSGVVTPKRDGSGPWIARRDIVLGAGIEDYAACGRPGDAPATR